MTHIRNAVPVFLVFATLTSCSCNAGENPVMEGEVEAVEIDVSVKIPGRLERITVYEGETVTRGQVLGYLESKAVHAKMDMANAAISEARSQFQYASKTYARIKKLYQEGAIPRQKFDEVSYQYNAARQKLEAMSGQRNEVKSYVDESILRSPIDGEVSSIISREGEIISPGYPVITILNPSDQWVVFHLREDRLKKIKKGNEVQIRFPALEKSYPFEISYISALGKFAKWKATNETGSFDLKTFEIHARPKGGAIAELRPGMTALITP